MKKRVVFEPFKEDMVLDVFDEDYACPSSAFEIDEMDAEQLDVLSDMREDDLSDIKNEIKSTLSKLKYNTNKKEVERLKRTLRMNTQKKHQLLSELRDIKNRMKMMEADFNYEEVAVA